MGAATDDSLPDDEEREVFKLPPFMAAMIEAGKAEAEAAVAAHPDVRHEMVARQREIMRHGDWVCDGRDIGSVVFPEAEVKVFLTASVDERARRRHAELVARGERVDLRKINAESQQLSSNPFAQFFKKDDGGGAGASRVTADIANIGDRLGGMLSAGVFLQEFVPADQPWVHIDIAGPAYNEKAPYGYTPKGGTGSAVRTFVELAENFTRH